MKDKAGWWRKANQLSIKISTGICIIFCLFVGIDISIHGQPKDYDFFLIGILAIGCFTLTWILTQLGHRINAGSSGAMRLGIVFTAAWLLIDTIFVLSPFDKDSRDIKAFIIFIVPIVVFWSILWVIKGFVNDKKAR